jgi:hypothetical protein
VGPCHVTSGVPGWTRSALPSRDVGEMVGRARLVFDMSTQFVDFILRTFYIILASILVTRWAKSHRLEEGCLILSVLLY